MHSATGASNTSATPSNLAFALLLLLGDLSVHPCDFTRERRSNTGDKCADFVQPSMKTLCPVQALGGCLGDHSFFSRRVLKYVLCEEGTIGVTNMFKHYEIS